MIRAAIFAVIVFIAGVIGLSWYLQPNDLARCNYTPSSQTGCQAVDAIVAISGGDTEARANWAINLYKKGWSHKIIFSGAAQDKSGPSNAAVMRKLAIKNDVPSDNIYIEEQAETTQQNAVDSVNLFNKLDINDVILVTSGYHQRRAFLEFNKLTPDITILNSPVVTDSDWSVVWWTTISGWWLALSEFVRIIFFHIVGV